MQSNGMVRSFPALRVAVACGVLACAASAVAQAAGPIQWPAGWTAQTLPTPNDQNGKPLSGVHQRATLVSSNNTAIAAMDFMGLDRPANEPVTVDQVIEGAQARMVQDYQAAGLTVQCNKPAAVSMGGLPGRILACSAFKQGKLQLEQAVEMAVGSTQIYSLTYSSVPDQYKTYLPAFDKARASLSLK